MVRLSLACPGNIFLFVNNMKLCSSIEKHSAPIEVVLSVRQREFFDGQAAFAHAVGRRGVNIAEE